MNGDDPKDAVERAATDAAFDAVRSRVAPAVSQQDTSVELPGDGDEGDPGEVAELLTDETSTIIRLHYDDPDYLAMMESELRRLEEHNLLDGITVITDDPTRFESDLKGRASGLYHTGTGEMYVAPEEIIGEEPRERKAEPGYFATDKNFGSLWHELGHHRIREENPNMDFAAMDGEDYWGQEVIEDFAAERFADSDKTAAEMSDTELQRAKNNLADHVEAQVGEYANFGGMEFIAEVHSGLMAGETYDDDIMALHDRLGGPVPPEAARDPSTAYEPMVAPGQAIEAAINDRLEEQALPRVGRFEEALTKVAVENWVDREWLIDAFTDNLSNRITLGIRLFPNEGDINPSDIHFDKESGLITDSLLRFPDIPGDGVTLDSPEHRERNRKIVDAVDSTTVPDTVTVEEMLAAGHVGKTPHVEVSETGKTPPREFAEWVAEVKVALDDAFERDTRTPLPGLDLTTEDGRREYFERVREESDPDRFTEVATITTGVVASNYDDENDPADITSRIKEDGRFKPGQPLDYWETRTSGVAEQMLVFLKKGAMDGEKLEWEPQQVVEQAAVEAAAGDENRHIRRLRRIVDVGEVTDFGDETMVNFHLPDAHPDSMASGIHFKNGSVPEATIRFPSLQEASQASRGVVNRFPEMVQSLELPRHDRFVSEGFEGHMDDLDRGERRIKTRIADRYGNNRLTPHVHLDSGVMALDFEAAEVIDFLSALIDAYEEEFAPYAPRDDVEFQATEAVYTSQEDADDVAGALARRTPAIIDEARYNGYFDDPNIYVGFTLPSMDPRTVSRKHINSGLSVNAQSGRIHELSMRFPGIPVENVSREALEAFADDINPGPYRVRVRTEEWELDDEKGSEDYHVHLHYSKKRRGEPGPRFPDHANSLNAAIRKWYSDIGDLLGEEDARQVKFKQRIADILPQYSDEEIKVYTPKGDDVHPSLSEAAGNGVFDGGDITVDTQPAGDLGPWDDPGVPKAESPTSFGYHYATVRMPVGDFRRLQTYIGTKEGIGKAMFGNPPVSKETFWGDVEQNRVDSIENVLTGKEEPNEYYDGIPMPYVEIGRDGTLIYTQEGRHRTVAAENAGLDTIPVRIVWNDEKAGEGGADGNVHAATTPDTVVRQLERLGMENIEREEIGERTDVIDFHVPSPHPDTEQRVVGSSLHLKSGEFQRLTLRFPTLDGHWDVERSLLGALSDGRIEETIDGMKSSGRVDALGGHASLSLEVFDAEGGRNIHLVFSQSKTPPGTDTTVEDALTLAKAALDEFNDILRNGGGDVVPAVVDNTMKGVRDAPVEVRRVVMQAEQWSDDEVTVTDTEYAGGHKVYTVDFDTSGGAGMSSSVVVTDEGNVSQMLLRTYAIPAEWWDGGSMESYYGAAEKLHELGDEIEEYIFENDPPGDAEAWDSEPRGHYDDGPVPHIWYDPEPNQRISVDEATAFIRRFLNGYFEQWPNAVRDSGLNKNPSVFQLAPGPAKAAADIVREHARDWADHLETDDVAGNAIINFRPRGFPRPEKDFHDNPTTIVINEDGTLADAMFRYGYLPGVEWQEDGGKGSDILAEMDVPDGVQAEYDLGDFGDIARPHLHLAGTEFGARGDVDFGTLMDFGRAFGDRLKDAYADVLDGDRGRVAPQAAPEDMPFDRVLEDASAYDDQSIEDVLDEYGAMHVTEYDGEDYYAVHENEVWVAIVGDDYAYAEPFEEWIFDSWTWGGGLSDFLDGVVRENFVEEFWRSTGTAYHVTEPDNAARIIASGELRKGSQTRGTGNTNVGAAVFLSRSAPQSIYGDVTFEVDVEAMDSDGFKPEVIMEPGILEPRQREAIASMFMADHFHADYPHDVSRDTVIVYDDIPLKYLSVSEGAPVDEIEQSLRQNASGEQLQSALAWLTEEAE